MIIVDLTLLFYDYRPDYCWELEIVTLTARNREINAGIYFKAYMRKYFSSGHNVSDTTAKMFVKG